MLSERWERAPIPQNIWEFPTISWRLKVFLTSFSFCSQLKGLKCNTIRRSSKLALHTHYGSTEDTDCFWKGKRESKRELEKASWGRGKSWRNGKWKGGKAVCPWAIYLVPRDGTAASLDLSRAWGSRAHLELVRGTGFGCCLSLVPHPEDLFVHFRRWISPWEGAVCIWNRMPQRKYKVPNN